MSNDILWAITRQNPLRTVVCRWVEETRKTIEKRVTIRVYFTYVGKHSRPPDLHKIWHIGSSCKLNQSYQIWCWSVQYSRSRRGTNFAVSHRFNKSSLPHCSTAVLAGDGIWQSMYLSCSEKTELISTKLCYIDNVSCKFANFAADWMDRSASLHT